MPEVSAGILLYRRPRTALEMLLVHPGGPLWAREDAAAWSIPKGLCSPGEAPEAAARREFAEETGYRPAGALEALGRFRQPSGKAVEVFALEGDFDPATLRSNSFELEWPPRSGRLSSFPEADRAQWFGPDEARVRIHAGQRPVIDSLLAHLGSR